MWCCKTVWPASHQIPHPRDTDDHRCWRILANLDWMDQYAREHMCTLYTLTALQAHGASESAQIMEKNCTEPDTWCKFSQAKLCLPSQLKQCWSCRPLYDLLLMQDDQLPRYAYIEWLHLKQLGLNWTVFNTFVIWYVVLCIIDIQQRSLKLSNLCLSAYTPRSVSQCLLHLISLNWTYWSETQPAH